MSKTMIVPVQNPALKIENATWQPLRLRIRIKTTGKIKSGFFILEMNVAKIKKHKETLFTIPVILCLIYNTHKITFNALWEYIYSLQNFVEAENRYLTPQLFKKIIIKRLF